MQIHSISKILGLIIVLITVFAIYFSNVRPSDISVAIFIPVFLIVLIYVFHGPLDHWWISQFPIKFDPILHDWLAKYFKPYNRLSDDEKKLFEYRMTLYMNGRLFQSVGAELREVPEDIKCMVAAHGVLIGMKTDDLLLGDMDRIYLYKHPFPTPDHPYLHNFEINVEDGVIILSLEQLANAVMHSDDYYNIGFHAFAEVFLATQKHVSLPDVPDSWTLIREISGWDQSAILTQTGLKEISILPVHIAFYFSKPEQYKSAAPLLFEQWKTIFV